MKSMMKRTTLREIKQSFGRYFAILAIVALGVGLFSGLKVTRNVMVASADHYLKKEQLYDFRLLSTLGFEEVDVEVLAGKEDVRAVSGAYSADILYRDSSDNERVIKVHSLTEGVNGVVLTAGRMPTQADECVVDSNLFSEDMIGQKVVFSENNEEDDLSSFAFREYTITGIAQSSLYVQFERGNSSLGSGRVSGFMYLLPEGFQMDVYTEIYVKFDEDAEIYSEAYKSYIEEKTPLWEDYCGQQAERRYDSIMAEAQEKLDDAQKTLDDKKAEAEKELTDAKDTLTEAQEEIDRNQEELADGERQLADAEKQLRDAKDQLAEKEKELSLAKQLLPETPTSLQEQMLAAQLAAAQEEIDRGKEELSRTERQLAEKKQELADGKAKLEEAKAELADGWTEYGDANADFEREIEDAQAEIDDARAEVEDIAFPDTYVLGRDTNVGYVCFENDSGIVDGIANVFPVFFFLVAALVCMTTMNRMVEEQRTQIGVLKALGYGEGAIMGKFLFYSGSAAFTGCVLGYVLGVHLFPLVIWIAYGMMYKMGGIVYVFDWKFFAISMAGALACSMGTTWVSCRRELREVAASLMRPRAPKAGKRVLLEYIPFIWKRLGFLQKVSVRNVVRYKKRFFMMVIGISGCTALLVTGFGVRDSVTDIADQQYEKIQLYDLSITLRDGVVGEQEQSEVFRGTAEQFGAAYMTAYEGACDLVFGGQIKGISLIIAQKPEEMPPFIDLHTDNGIPIAYPGEGEAVISDKLAQTYRIKVGDTITLRDDEQKSVSAVVTGICENYIYNYVYLQADTYEAVFGRITYKNVYVNLPADADAHAAGAAFMKTDGVTAVSVKMDMLTRVSSMMSSMNYIVFVIIGCAGALAFVVLYNLNNINITERIREIATIKVLGFYKKETASYVFRENMALTAVGCAVGLILGRLLHMYVMSRINVDMISFDEKVKGISYLLSILLTFFFNWTVNRMMSGKLEKINMAESLKSVD